MRTFAHYIEIFTEGEPNAYGETGSPVMVCDLMGDVVVRSGSEAASYGASATSTVITVQTYVDSRVQYGHTLKWNGREFRIDHTRPDEIGQYMIITAKDEVRNGN